MATVNCPSCGTAINVPEKKTGLYWGIGCLIAAIAIPVIVAVIGLLAAIAIPSFVKARQVSQHHACVNNLRIIDAAKEQAALEKNYNTSETATTGAISVYIPNGYAALRCPAGGNYTINPIGHDPACSQHGSLSEALDKRAGTPQPSPTR